MLKRQKSLTSGGKSPSKSPGKSILKTPSDLKLDVKCARSKDKHLSFKEQPNIENISPDRKKRYTEKEYSDTIKNLLSHIPVDYQPENLPLRPWIEVQKYHNVETNVSTPRLEENTYVTVEEYTEPDWKRPFVSNFSVNRV